MAKNIDSHKRDAVQQFLAEVVVPLFYELPDHQVDQVGSGLFFKDDLGAYFITARHTFVGFEKDSFLFPEKPRGSLLSLAFEFTTAMDLLGMDIDVAILRLTQPEIVMQVRNGWRFLTKDDVSEPSSSTGTYVISGYPSSRGTIVGEKIVLSLNTIYTELMTIPHEAEQPVHPEVDLFFHYDAEANGLNGEPMATPLLPGVSGSAIWECRDVNGIWTAARSLKIVGIETSYLAGKYVRGKQWYLVQKMLDGIPPLKTE